MLALFSPAWPLQPCCSTRTDGHCRNWHEKVGPVNEDGPVVVPLPSRQTAQVRVRSGVEPRATPALLFKTRPDMQPWLQHSAHSNGFAIRFTLYYSSCITKTRQTGKGAGVFQPERFDILTHHLLVEHEKLSFSVPALVGPARRRVRVGGAVRLASPTRWCMCTVLRRGVRQQSMLPSTLPRGQGLSSFSSGEEYHHSMKTSCNAEHRVQQGQADRSHGHPMFGTIDRSARWLLAVDGPARHRTSHPPADSGPDTKRGEGRACFGLLLLWSKQSNSSPYKCMIDECSSRWRFFEGSQGKALIVTVQPAMQLPTPWLKTQSSFRVFTNPHGAVHSKTAQIEKDIASSVQNSATRPATAAVSAEWSRPQRLETRNKGRAAICALLLFHNSSIETPKPHSPTAIGNVGARGKLASCPLPREKATSAGRQSKPRQAKASHWRTEPLVSPSVRSILFLLTARYCVRAGSDSVCTHAVRHPPPV